MIGCGPPPSNQSELDLGGPGAERMREAREWVHGNPEAFGRYMRLARHQMHGASDGKASPNSIREQMRGGMDVVSGTLVFDRRMVVEFKNGMTPALARIAMEQDPGIRFRLARSSVDGFTDAAL